MKATRRKVIPLAGLAASGILGANMSGFAIEVAGEQAPVCLTQPTIEQLTIRRRGAGLRGYGPDRAWRSAFTQSSAELDDWLLPDIGVIRERDIGISREQARRAVELFWQT